MSKLCHVGIDVSAGSLTVTLLKRGEVIKLGDFANTSRGHKALIKQLGQVGAPVRVCLEATGNYSLDVAVALDKAKGIEVMVVNPKAASRFGEAMMQRAKTDSVDSLTLAEFAARMPFVPWTPPNKSAFKLRSLSRRAGL